MQNFDTIIVWSWLWWLSAWSFLAQKWQKVLVLEKHYISWWYATSFKRKNYEFDVALHQIWWIEKTWFKQILKNTWIYNKLEFIKHKYLYEAIYPDFKIKVENWNYKKFMNDLINIFPQEEKWIKKWFNTMKYTGNQLKIYDFASRNKIFLPLVMIFAPILIPYFLFFEKTTIWEILDKCTNNTKLQTVLMELIWYYWDDYNISALSYLIPSYWFYFDWGYYVKWWGQAVSNAFIDVIKENNWEVINSCDVEEFILKNEKIIWVKTKSGDFYAKNFICNASPFILYEKFLKNWEWSKKEIEKLEKFKIWVSIWSAYIWISTQIENLNPDYKDSYILTDNTEKLKEDSFWLTITNNNDNPNIPIWKTVLTIAFFDKYSNRQNLNREKYLLKKQEKKELLTNKLKNIFPNIEKHIEVFELWTAKTMERYTWNKLWSIYGFAQLPFQNMRKSYWINTPFNNLYISSAWALWWWFEWVIRCWNEVSKKIV